MSAPQALSRSRHLNSCPRDQILARGPHAISPAWRGQRRDRATSQPRVYRAYETRIAIEDTSVGGRKVRLEDSDGGTVLVENLPLNTQPHDIVELFTAMVGPVEHSTFMYNDKGGPKGMALVKFQDARHAYVARQKFHGQLIDTNRPMHIRVVLDVETPPVSASVHPQISSNPRPLASPSYPKGENHRDRIDNNQRRASAPVVASSASLLDRVAPLPLHARLGPQRTNNTALLATPMADTIATSSTARPSQSQVSAGRKRVKKGPKRTSKSTLGQARADAVSRKWTPQKKTAEELDAEMEAWNAAKPALPQLSL